MRTLSFIPLLTALATPAGAAPSDTTLRNVHFTIGAGLEVAHRAGLSMMAGLTVYPEGGAFGLGLQGRLATYRAAETPRDYVRYVKGFKLFETGYEDPRDEMLFGALTFSRLQRLQPLKPGGAGSYVRFDAGPSLVHHAMTYFINTSTTYADYYTLSSSYTTAGLYAAVQWNVRAGHWVDMGFGLWTNWTPRATPVGLDLLFHFKARNKAHYR